MPKTRFWLGLLAAVMLCCASVGSAWAQAAASGPARPAQRQRPAPTEEQQKQQDQNAASAPITRPIAPASPAPQNLESLDLENTLYMDLEYGRVVIKMHPELAPKHVARIKELVRQGFYDGNVFHRVIDGFMAQTGDPTGTGNGGSGVNIPAEFNSGKHTRGAVGMARSANINSADSQFFIVLEDSLFLDGQYTYWGEVVSGMEFVDRIRRGDPNENGAVPYPDRIVRMQVAADAVKTEGKGPMLPTEGNGPPKPAEGN